MKTSEVNITEKVFVITRNAGFWGTDICKTIFPRIFLLPARPSKLQYIFYITWGVMLTFFVRPKILLLGTSTKLPIVFAWLRSKGIFKDIKIITDNQHLKDYDISYIDKVIVYSPEEIETFNPSVRHKIVSVHFPSKVELVDVTPQKGDYIFCGGNHRRDHVSFIKAMRGVDAKALVVTKDIFDISIPANVVVKGQMPLDEYTQKMAESKFVVIPLEGINYLPHGHCDISTALSLGKIVVSTKDASADSYIQEGQDGFLVEAGNVDEYRRVIKELLNNRDMFDCMAAFAEKGKDKFSYDFYAKKLLALCQEVFTE